MVAFLQARIAGDPAVAEMRVMVESDLGLRFAEGIVGAVLDELDEPRVLIVCGGES